MNRVEREYMMCLELDAKRLREECDGLRRQVAELTALGVSLHKASAVGRDAERAAVVAWLRERADTLAPSIRPDSRSTALDAAADSIERGAHREGE